MFFNTLIILPMTNIDNSNPRTTFPTKKEQSQTTFRYLEIALLYSSKFFSRFLTAVFQHPHVHLPRHTQNRLFYECHKPVIQKQVSQPHPPANSEPPKIRIRTAVVLPLNYFAFASLLFYVLIHIKIKRVQPSFFQCFHLFIIIHALKVKGIYSCFFQLFFLL